MYPIYNLKRIAYTGNACKNETLDFIPVETDISKHSPWLTA